MKQTQLKGRQNLLIIFLFHLLLFTYPLLTLLWHRSYPVFTAEVSVLFLAVVAFSFVLTAILSNVRSTIASLLTALLITIILLIQFNLLLEGVAICLVGSMMIAWRLKAKFHLYGLPVVAALILGAWLDSTEVAKKGLSTGASVNVNSELLPIVHVLLDGFVGLDGLPPYPSSAVIKDEVFRFFEDYNFQVFPRAYSRYSATVDSLNSAFNFQNDAESKYAWEVLSRRKHVLESNAQFDLLDSLGYRLNIYQTAHLDLCQSNPGNLDRCWGYEQPNVESIQQAKSIQVRSGMLASVLLNQSSLLSGLLSSQGWLLNQGVAVHDPRVFSQLRKDILKEPDGRFFFAHVLLPHAPFTYLHDCSINYQSDIWERYPVFKNEPEQIESVYEIRTGMYYEQMECALVSLRQIFDDMKNAGIFERSIIIIHGDHGSMIAKYLPRPWNIDQLTAGEYRAHFSTLFAVKFPHTEFQVNNRTLPLSALFEGFSKAIGNYVAGDRSAEILSNALFDDPNKVDSYVYLLGSDPMRRVDINIFED